MVRRHPHVFESETGERTEVADAAEQTGAWERAKEKERETRGAKSLLDGVPRGMFRTKGRNNFV